MVANIVSQSNIDIDKEFNVVKTMDEIIHGLPTLIIGFDYVNKHYPDFDITKFQLEPNLYWTFRKNEKRDKYEYDLSLFINKVYCDLVQDISYVFVDPIHYNKKTLYKIIKKVKSLKNIISYVNNDMVYIYSDKIIFGVDLKLLSYIGFNKDGIKAKIKQISSVFLHDSRILIEYKNVIQELDNQVKYVPYLYSIKNEQNSTDSLIHISRENRMVS
jgi:hypothetical protein